MPIDILLTGGLIVDGSGNEPFVGSVGITNDKISLIEEGQSNANAKEEISVAGLVVSPGFIDIHSHSEIQPLVDRQSLSKLFDGVTTIVSGNCGFSVFPWSSDMPRDGFPLFRDLDVSFGWPSFSHWEKAVNKQEPALNHASFLGHGTLRVLVMGLDYKEPTNNEMIQMANLLDENMAQGALGLSTGLEYSPACCARMEELEKLAEVVVRHNGCHSSHLRDEGEKVVESVKEAISLCQKTGVRTQLSHLKAYGRDNWQLIDDIIHTVEKARQASLPVFADRYPYCATSTTLHAILPTWLLDGGIATMVKRLSQNEVLSQLEEEMKTTHWDEVHLAHATKEQNKKWQGKSISHIAKCCHKAELDTFLHIIKDEAGAAMGVYHSLSEDNLQRLLKKAWLAIGSDGSARKTKGPLSRGVPHPRCYGTFARFLGKYVRQEALVDLEEAVRKMTALPAQQLGLGDRGRLSVGLAADVTVFDFEKIVDRATYEKPHQYSQGIVHLFVNGVPTLIDGELTSSHGGRVIKRSTLV